MNKNLEDITGLIVEDQIGMRRIIRTVLQSLGIGHLVEAADGAEGLHQLRERNRGWAHEATAEFTSVAEILRPIDFVICDWAMPNMTGMELLAAVRNDPNLMNLPFVMLTAENSKEQIVEALKHGVTDYIIKPFTTNLLEGKLKSILIEKFQVRF